MINDFLIHNSLMAENLLNLRNIITLNAIILQEHLNKGLQHLILNFVTYYSKLFYNWAL